MHSGLSIARIALALVACTASVAAAQTAAQSPPQLAPGQHVWVRTFDGVAHEGRVAQVSPASIQVTTPGEDVSWVWAEVWKVETPDPIWNGLRNGAIAGSIAGAVFGMGLGYGMRCKSDCGPDYNVARDVAGGALIVGVVGAGYGLACGALLDAVVHRRRTVYEAQGPALDIDIRPLRSGARVEITLGWR